MRVSAALPVDAARWCGISLTTCRFFVNLAAPSRRDPETGQGRDHFHRLEENFALSTQQLSHYAGCERWSYLEPDFNSPVCCIAWPEVGWICVGSDDFCPQAKIARQRRT